jgi:hypothetical protein
MTALLKHWTSLSLDIHMPIPFENRYRVRAVGAEIQ